MRQGNKIVSFVSYFGHAFRVTWRSITLWTAVETLLLGMAPPTMLSIALQLEKYTPFLAVLGGLLWLTAGWRLFWRTKHNVYVDGEGPEDADIYEGASFRQFVIDVLTRPENNKNSQQPRKPGDTELILNLILPKTMIRFFLAGRSFGKGDLKKAYKNLAKAYLSLPRRFQLTYFGCWLLDCIAGTKQMIRENTPLTNEDLRYMRNKFYFALFFEHPLILIAAFKPEFVDEERPDEEDLREHIEKILNEKVEEPVDAKKVKELLRKTIGEV
jgi:hypothetical protein